MPGIHFSCSVVINRAKDHLKCNLSARSWDFLFATATRRTRPSFCHIFQTAGPRTCPTHLGSLMHWWHSRPQKSLESKKCNSFWMQACNVNVAAALPSPPPPPHSSQIQMFFISTRRTNLPHLISSGASSLWHSISPSPSAYCFYSPTFVSGVLKFAV